MRWGAVLAGAAFAIGLWILLQTLGMGLGLAAVDIDDAGSLKGVGVGTGIWSLLAPLIAMFVGSYLAGRLAGTRDRRVGAMHGSVMWALATALGLWAMFSVVSGMVSGAARVGGAAAGATTQVVSGAMGAAGRIDTGDVMSALGVDTNDLLGPINERLQAQGKPPITSNELDATIKAVAQRGLREGQLDQQVLVEELARNTALSRADAEDIAARFGDRYQDVASRVSARAKQVGEDAKRVGLKAADRTGKALLLGGLMMLLSLGAAIAGGVLGVRSHDRDDRRRRTTTTTHGGPDPVTGATTRTVSTTGERDVSPTQSIRTTDEREP